MAVTALLKLAGLSNGTRYVDLAHEALTKIQPMMAQYPLGFGQWLAALSYALSRPREIVIIGKLEAPDTTALLGIAQDGYQPYQIVAVGAADSHMILPALQDRDQIGDRATAYVCDAPASGRAFACRSPMRMSFVPSSVEEKQDLERQTGCEAESILYIAYTTLNG
jgi:uncharacterized protein YyaL (SSP411 family)